MSEIQFEEEEYTPRRSTAIEERPLFVRLVRQTGIVSTDAQAERVLLGLAVGGIVFALAILYFSGGSHVSVPQNVVNARLELPPEPMYR